jgi:hypothetical protein
MMKRTYFTVFALLLWFAGCKQEAPEPVPETKPPIANSCEAVFANMSKLCRAHPQCRTTLANLHKEQSSFLTSCEENAKPENLRCASQATSWPAFMKCSTPKTPPPKP